MMVDAYTVSNELTPDPADVELIRAGLSAFNNLHVDDNGFAPITLVVRDSEESVVGGLLGGTYWGWLAVEILWLAESTRHQGLGTRLLERAEQIAVERGCHAAHLDTMSFQALPFYQQHGYTIFGTLTDLPRGHKRYFLMKNLTRENLTGEASNGEANSPAPL